LPYPAPDDTLIPQPKGDAAMSKLADAIRRSQRVDSAPMGFGAARPAAKASMLVGYFGPAADIANGRDAGADFLLIDARGSNFSPDAAKAARDAAGDLPLGAWASVPDSAAATALSKAGVDFLVVDDSAPAAALLNEDLGYVLGLPQQPAETFLRSLEPLSLEALLLGDVPSPLTVAGQVELSRAGAIARRPLLCDVEASASADDLLCLRAAGVAGVMVGAAGLAALKESVAALPPRRARREERAVVSLPRSQAAAEPDDDDDDLAV
jgi:hypothetical protein